MAEERDLVCPDGMDRQLYLTLKKDYTKARARHGMSVTNGLKPQTIAKNLRLMEQEKSKLKEHLTAYSQHPELRQILSTCNSTATQTLELLRESVLGQGKNHREVLAKLQLLVDRVGASSSFVAPAAAADNAMQVDHPTCNICLDDSANGFDMPCCSRPGNAKHVCGTCFMAMASQKRDVACPNCRTELLDHPDFAAIALKLQLALPAAVRKMLHQPGPKTFVPLRDVVEWDRSNLDEDTEDTSFGRQWFGDYHFQAHGNSKQCLNPAWVDLVFGEPPVTKRVPLATLSVKDDDVDLFVRQKCCGKWPKRGTTIRVTCGQFVAHYRFVRFQKSYLEETACKFSMGYDKDFETLCVPLCRISAWRDLEAWSAEETAGLLRFNGPPKQIIVKLQDCPFVQCFIRDVLEDAVGPRLHLSKTQNGAVQTAYLGMVELLNTEDIVPKSPNPITVFNCMSPTLPTPSIVKPFFSPLSGDFRFKDAFHCRDVCFFGYSDGWNKTVWAHFTLDFVHLKVAITDIVSLTFVREAGQ